MRVDKVIGLLSGEVVLCKEFIDIFIMFEDDARIIVIIHLANNEQAANIFFCQEREALSETCDAVFISCAGAVVDKVDGQNNTEETN